MTTDGPAAGAVRVGDSVLSPGVGYCDISELAGRGYWYGSAGLTYDLRDLHSDAHRA